MGEKIRVLVADDEAAVVDVLRTLIESQEDLRFVGFANDTESAIALAVEEQPDVALVDVRMPGGGGIRAAREISRRCPPTKVIALTAHEDEQTVIAMMAAGAMIVAGETCTWMNAADGISPASRTAARNAASSNSCRSPTASASASQASAPRIGSRATRVRAEMPTTPEPRTS